MATALLEPSPTNSSSSGCSSEGSEGSGSNATSSSSSSDIAECPICFTPAGIIEGGEFVRMACCDKRVCTACFDAWHGTSEFCMYCRADTGLRRHVVAVPPQRPRSTNVDDHMRARLAAQNAERFHGRVRLFCLTALITLMWWLGGTGREEGER